MKIIKNIRIELSTKSVCYYTVDSMENASSIEILDYLVKEQLVDMDQVVNYQLYA